MSSLENTIDCDERKGDENDDTPTYALDRLPQFGDADDTSARDCVAKELGSVIYHQEGAIEQLAQHILNGRRIQPTSTPRVLALMGPPGVGKTVASGYMADLLNSTDGKIPSIYRDDPTLDRPYFLEVACNQSSKNSDVAILSRIEDFYSKLQEQPLLLSSHASSSAAATQTIEQMFNNLISGSSQSNVVMQSVRHAVILLDEPDKSKSIWAKLMQFFQKTSVDVKKKGITHSYKIPAGWDLTVIIATNAGEHLIGSKDLLEDLIQDLRQHFRATVLGGQESHASRVLNHIIVFRPFLVEELEAVTHRTLDCLLNQIYNKEEIQLFYDEIFWEFVLKSSSPQVIRTLQADLLRYIQTALSKVDALSKVGLLSQVGVVSQVGAPKVGALKGSQPVVFLSCKNNEPYVAFHTAQVSHTIHWVV